MAERIFTAAHHVFSTSCDWGPDLRPRLFSHLLGIYKLTGVYRFSLIAGATPASDGGFYVRRSVYYRTDSR